MKAYSPLQGFFVAVAAFAISGVSAHSAPKKAEPQPAVEETPAPKKVVAGKAKSSPRLKKNPEPAAAATESKAAPGPGPGAKAKPAPDAGRKAVAKTPPEELPAPEKRGFIRKLFTKEPKQETETETKAETKAEANAEPKLAKAKTVKPAPVKEVKSVKSVKLESPDKKLAVSDEESPKKKRGIFGFLRRDRSPGIEIEGAGATIPDEAKIERPADWQDSSFVKEDAIALYEYGPAQSNGPDARLGRGTLVKVKQIQRGWALVEVAGGGRRGYMDASALRSAEKDDFRDPVIQQVASLSPNYWAPAAPPPDLPDQPGPTANDAALLLLPPLELEPKKP